MGNKNGKPVLSKADADYLVAHTNLTLTNIQNWYAGFMQDCPSGQLSNDKFTELYSTIFPNGDSEAFCLHAFNVFDTDNSGTIDFKEFMMAISACTSGNPREKLEWAFKIYDMDGAGSIEKQELMTIIESMYSMVGSIDTKESRQRAEKIFACMDTDGDGHITQEEFIAACMSDKELMTQLGEPGP